MNCLRMLCGYTWVDHRSNISVRGQCHLPSISGEVRFRWLGHVARMPQDRLPFIVLFGQLPGPGVQGRPRETWKSIEGKDLAELDLPQAGLVLLLTGLHGGRLLNLYVPSCRPSLN